MDKRQKQNKNKNSHKAAASRNVQKQQQPKRHHTLSWHNRSELKDLVANLLEIAFKPPVANNKDEWDQYVNIQALLNRIMVLEAGLATPNANATPANRLANIDAFCRWATENGLRFEGLEIAEFSGFELGLKATRDIDKDELIFAIPRKLMLTEVNLDPETKNPQFFTMSNIKLAYTLMLEALKPNSFWRPYIDLLPQRYNTVLYFSQEDMEQLRGTSALSQALRQCKSIARQYGFIYTCNQQLKHSTNMLPMGLLFQEQFSYELYRWAVSTVMTRENMIPTTVAVDGKPPEMIAALIPFWDMANHRHGEVTSFYNIETERMESTAQEAFKLGEQIFIHYGNSSNAELLVHNGFVNPAKPNDSVGIKLGLSTSDPLYDKRLKLLEQLKISRCSELDVLPAPIYISPGLLAFVRGFNMNGEQLDHWIESGRAFDLWHIDCALETSLETKTWQYLQTRLMLLLRVFPTTLEADEEQLAKHLNGSLDLSYNMAMGLQYRVLEKRILAGALDYCKQRTKA